MNCAYAGMLNVRLFNGAPNPALGFPLQGDINSYEAVFYVNASGFNITGSRLGVNKIFRPFTGARFYPGGVSTLAVTGNDPGANYSSESTPLTFFRGRGFATASPATPIAQGSAGVNSIPIITFDATDQTQNYTWKSPSARMLKYTKPVNVMDFDMQQDNVFVLALGNNQWAWGWRNPVNNFVSTVSLGVYSQELESSGFPFQPFTGIPFNLVGGGLPAVSPNLATGVNYMIVQMSNNSYLYKFSVNLNNYTTVGTLSDAIVLDNGIGTPHGAQLLKGTCNGFLLSTSNNTLTKCGYFLISQNCSTYWGINFSLDPSASPIGSLNNIRTPTIDEQGNWWIQTVTNAGRVYTTYQPGVIQPPLMQRFAPPLSLPVPCWSKCFR